MSSGSACVRADGPALLQLVVGSVMLTPPLPVGSRHRPAGCFPGFPLQIGAVVSGSVMLTPPLPVGSTVTVQFWLLPWVFRCAFLMLAPLTLNAWSRIRA